MYSGGLSGPGWHLLLPLARGAYPSSRWNVSPSPREPPLLQGRDLGHQRKVAIVVEDRKTMPESARGDQAIDPGPDRHSRSASQPIKLSRLLKDFAPQRRFHNRKCQQRLPCQTKGTLITEALEDLLDNRQASDDFVELDHCVELEPSRLPEDLDPD